MFSAICFCKGAFLLFWLAGLRPMRKTVKNIALSKKPLAAETPKDITQVEFNPVLRHNVLKFRQ
jgi:hypothetical protein